MVKSSFVVAARRDEAVRATRHIETIETAELVAINNRPRRRIGLIAPNGLKKSFAARLIGERRAQPSDKNWG